MIQLLTAKNNEYYFKVVANNGETIVTSETYKTKGAAEGGVVAMFRAIKPSIVDRTLEEGD